ncbi:MAG: SMP-30/gluconolactonase/LRE family protein [Actinobacteria bacterium]|nr:SMP-30/gluconolactonase/LRE family protein [Actinomycetota bacterium]
MRRTIPTTTLLVLAAATLLGTPAEGRQSPPGTLEVSLFTRVGDPGQPEGLWVDDAGTVYVGTHNAGRGDADAPSALFAYDPTGSLLREYVIEGQDLDADHGILGIAADADGVLYILDRAPARVLTLDPRTGDQATYATFHDVPVCAAADDDQCSEAVVDLAPFPDYPVFAPDGTMYVTDLEQGLLWRVAPGGGEAEVWFTDARLESVFGPNGIQFLPDGRTLLFAQTGSTPPGATDPATGKLYTLPVASDGSPGELEVFWEGRPVDGPDGFAIARSGNVYVALAGANQVMVLGPDGSELARVPATPIGNQQQEVPFDTPASVAFLGGQVLVTNQSFFTGTESHWAVLAVDAGEEALPFFEPRIASTGTGDGGAGAADAPASTSTRGLPATGGAAVPAALGVLLVGFALRRRPA